MVEQLMGQFREVETGKREDAVQRRPQLQAALTAYKRQKAILVIAKPDRLTRNTHFITGLRKSKVDFVACDYPFADTMQIQVAGRVRRARVCSRRGPNCPPRRRTWRQSRARRAH